METYFKGRTTREKTKYGETQNTERLTGVASGHGIEITVAEA